MQPNTNYDAASTALARLLNQDSIQTAESARVAFFIASGIQRILRAFDFPQQLLFASVTTDVNGRVALGALRLGETPGIDSVNDGTYKYTYVTPSQKYRYKAGSYYYNIVQEAGVWVLYSSEANKTLTIGYYDTPDTITSGAGAVTVALQPMIIAKAALIYYRAAQDPEADVTQEEDMFRQELAEIMEAAERRRPQRFAQTRRDTYGQHLGYTGGGRGRYRGLP